MKRFALVAAAMVVTAGCGKLPGAAAGRPMTTAEAQAFEPGLNDEPALSIEVPTRATRMAPMPTHGNALKAYVSPVETLPAVLALVDGAEKSLYLETFNFGNDSYGKRLVPKLVAKAQAGVEVKVVMDYVGSRFLKDHGALLKALRAGGVDVQRYMPRTIRKDDKKLGINIQHRKVYLADGQRALVGGVNLMKDFDTINQDVLVGFQGPVVADLYKEFAHDYAAAGGKAPVLQPAPAAGTGNAQAQVVVTSPREGRFEAREAIFAAVDGAQRTLDIENQYLWDDKLMVRIHAAIARGVKVRVMVPGAEHKSIFKTIHAEELKSLIDEGAQARVYHGVPEDAHLHVKYYGVDDRWLAIGSTNGDTRALNDNQELSVAITDPAMAVEMRQRLFEHDWAERSAPFVYQPSNVVTRPFRKLLEILDYYL